MGRRNGKPPTRVSASAECVRDCVGDLEHRLQSRCADVLISRLIQFIPVRP